MDVATLYPMEIERVYDYGGDVDWQSVADRMGEAALRARIEKQNLNTLSSVRRMHFLRRELIKQAAEIAFFICGIRPMGRRNFRDVQVVHQAVTLERLPESMRGLRILQLTDLHLDLDPGFGGVIAERVQGLEYDLAVITGDFRNLNYGDFTLALAETRTVLDALNGPVYGILGNHDDLEIALYLEQMGVKMLLNESAAVPVKGETLWLCGVDDPHYFQTDDISRALQGVPPAAFKILLSHSPETYREAADQGFDYFLCGHTHGGQICLPGGVPIITRSYSPRWCARGAWQWQGMQGYTSTGTGGCGAMLRLNCPPEAVIHELN